MKKDDYIAGGHHFWIHFWFGLVFGVGFGAWICWWTFHILSRMEFIALTAAIGLAVACCSGRWGDSAWEWIVEYLLPPY